ncbi:transketolase C-terminal domain-containing protein [Nonomuraea sp. NPDC052116]|uniref:alpha-ketoacid dehydrogenase subunit beta n=1 Tax=Nonomuraea sp. NPDC052116 TaxID=3155665 RepID=UPI0034298BEF
MRVAESLNRALHEVLAEDPSVRVLGEDVLDPYGGAFKITKGLSSRFPGRVLATPISENGIVGVAGGLALAGGKAIVEIMFSDFVALAFDQIVNFASKSVSMYGRPLRLPLIVRCPSGGGRGYGPTHSQSLQKHFIGVPGLAVYEVSPFDDHRELFGEMLARGEPCLLFEDKILYTRQLFGGGVADDLFQYDVLPGAGGVARVYVDDPEQADCVIIAPGGLAHRALAAMRTLLLEREVSCLLLVPRRLYPFDVTPLSPLLERAGAVVVAEESTAGGTWGAEVAHQVHSRLWGRLRRPVSLVHSAASVIPAAAHLERDVLVQDTAIVSAVQELLP